MHELFDFEQHMTSSAAIALYDKRIVSYNRDFFFIIRSASMRDLSSNVANYNKDIIMRLKSLINVVTLVIAKIKNAYNTLEF
jgi:hypothetical protein